MTIPKFKEGDIVCFAACGKDREYLIYAMRITRVYHDGKCWRCMI